jgi:hypothetical protein
VEVDVPARMVSLVAGGLVEVDMPARLVALVAGGLVEVDMPERTAEGAEHPSELPPSFQHSNPAALVPHLRVHLNVPPCPLIWLIRGIH